MNKGRIKERNARDSEPWAGAMQRPIHPLYEITYTMPFVSSASLIAQERITPTPRQAPH